MSDEYVTCETTAAIVLHVRRIGSHSIRLSGHSNKPYSLCHLPIDWDTQRPVSERIVTCRSCRKAMGWPEWLVVESAK